MADQPPYRKKGKVPLEWRKPPDPETPARPSPVPTKRDRLGRPVGPPYTEPGEYTLNGPKSVVLPPENLVLKAVMAEEIERERAARHRRKFLIGLAVALVALALYYVFLAAVAPA